MLSTVRFAGDKWHVGDLEQQQQETSWNIVKRQETLRNVRKLRLRMQWEAGSLWSGVVSTSSLRGEFPRRGVLLSRPGCRGFGQGRRQIRGLSEIQVTVRHCESASFISHPSTRPSAKLQARGSGGHMHRTDFPFGASRPSLQGPLFLWHSEQSQRLCRSVAVKKPHDAGRRSFPPFLQGAGLPGGSTSHLRSFWKDPNLSPKKCRYHCITRAGTSRSASRAFMTQRLTVTTQPVETVPKLSCCLGQSTSGWWLGHPSEKYEFVNWDD